MAGTMPIHYLNRLRNYPTIWIKQGHNQEGGREGEKEASIKEEKEKTSIKEEIIGNKKEFGIQASIVWSK